MVTASLLFHETPTAVSQTILQEAFRLLVSGGQVLILDGNQKTIRRIGLSEQCFENRTFKEYAAASIDAWMGAAGFSSVQTQDVWWINQVTSESNDSVSRRLSKSTARYTPTKGTPQ